MRTYMPKAGDIAHKWYLIDAKGKTLGRLATRVATILRGKHRPDYAPHLDQGDGVIIVNASEVAVTGKKSTDKIYHHHTGYPGGIKAQNFETLQAKAPGRVIEKAVRGMLPRGPLGRKMFGKLRVYAGAEHPHTSQQPIEDNE